MNLAPSMYYLKEQNKTFANYLLHRKAFESWFLNACLEVYAIGYLLTQRVHVPSEIIYCPSALLSDGECSSNVFSAIVAGKASKPCLQGCFRSSVFILASFSYLPKTSYSNFSFESALDASETHSLASNEDSFAVLFCDFFWCVSPVLNIFLNSISFF